MSNHKGVVSLSWKKQSYKRYIASVGSLTIEVRRAGIAPSLFWMVGEVFGQHHHTHGPDNRHEWLIDAQWSAELTAIRLLEEARTAMRYAGLKKK